MCALAEINFEGNEGIIVKKLVSFHNGHDDCDKTYPWGLQWTAGSKYILT
jgi:tellurite resistance protein TerA